MEDLFVGQGMPAVIGVRSAFALDTPPTLRYLRGHAAGEARPKIVAFVGRGKDSEALSIFTGIDYPF